MLTAGELIADSLIANKVDRVFQCRSAVGRATCEEQELHRSRQAAQWLTGCNPSRTGFAMICLADFTGSSLRLTRPLLGLTVETPLSD